MFQLAARLVKWVSIPVLLIAALFSCFAASYELLVDLVICTGAVICVQRAVRSRGYFWAAGFLLIVIVFSPLVLAIKIFLLMGFTCIAAFGALFVAFRPQPVPVL